MQTLLPQENLSFKDKIESFTKSFIKDKKEIRLKDFWQSLFKEGFISSSNSFLQNILLTQAICKINPGIGLFLLTQFGCIEILQTHGNKEIKENYLNKLLSGGFIGCFSITEPNAGSDVTMIETKAKNDKEIWTINGHKIWASNGSISDIIIVFAQTKEYRDKTGITCFIILSQTKEIQILPDTPKLGVKITPSNEIIIKNLKVPKSSQIGNIGDGIKIALKVITLGRIFCAAQAIGLLEGCLEEVIKHSTKRNQFGKSISENQAIQWYLADMTKDLDAATLLLYKAVWAKKNNTSELQKLSSMAKYFSTTVSAKHANKAVQILGGKGLIDNSYIANAYRDSKVLEIYEGTNEIQKIILSRELNLN